MDRAVSVQECVLGYGVVCVKSICAESACGPACPECGKNTLDFWSSLRFHVERCEKGSSNSTEVLGICTAGAHGTHKSRKRFQSGLHYLFYFTTTTITGVR